MLRTSLALFCLALLQAARPAAPGSGRVSYEAFAIRFGILPAFPVSPLVTADRGRRLDIPVMVWLCKRAAAEFSD
jgi:hypothetical protein